MDWLDKIRELIETGGAGDEQPDVQQPSTSTPRPGSPGRRPGPWWSRLLAAVAVALLVVLLAGVLLAIEAAYRGRIIFRALRIALGAEDDGGDFG